MSKKVSIGFWLGFIVLLCIAAASGPIVNVTSFTQGFLLKKSAAESRAYLGISTTNAAGTNVPDNVTIEMAIAGTMNVKTTWVDGRVLVFSNWARNMGNLIGQIHPTNFPSTVTTKVSPRGDDSTAGRGFGEFATISNAVKVLQSGDTLLLSGPTNTIWPVQDDNSTAFKSTVHLHDLTNICIRGDGAVVIQALTNVGMLVTFSNCYNVEIRDLIWYGQTNLLAVNASNWFPAAGNQVMGAIMSSGSNGVWNIHNCTFESFPDQIISHAAGWPQSVRDLWVHDNVARNWGNKGIRQNATGDGTFVSGLMSENCVIERNQCFNGSSFFEWGQGGETAAYSNRVFETLIIRDNVVSNMAAWVINLDNPATNNFYRNAIISGNRFVSSTNTADWVNSSSLFGSRVRGVENLSWINNDVLFSPWTGLELLGGYNDISNAVVTGGSFIRSRKLPINAQSSNTPNLNKVQRLTLRGVSFTDYGVGGGASAFVANGAVNCRVLNCTFYRGASCPNSTAFIAPLNGINSFLVGSSIGYATNLIVQGNTWEGEADNTTYIIYQWSQFPLKEIRFVDDNIMFSGSAILPNYFVGGAGGNTATRVIVKMSYFGNPVGNSLVGSQGSTFVSYDAGVDNGGSLWVATNLTATAGGWVLK